MSVLPCCEIHLSYNKCYSLLRAPEGRWPSQLPRLWARCLPRGEGIFPWPGRTSYDLRNVRGHPECLQWVIVYFIFECIKVYKSTSTCLFMRNCLWKVILATNKPIYPIKSDCKYPASIVLCRIQPSFCTKCYEMFICGMFITKHF